MKKILLSSALCASFLFAANNPSKEHNYEVTLFGSGILSDSKSGLGDDNYLNGGISLGKNLGNSFIDQVEIAYLRSDNLEYENSSEDTNVNRAFLNAIKKYELTEKLAAYGLAGIGYQNITHEAAEFEDSPLLNYGLGLRYDLPYYTMALKGDIRHIIATKNNQNDIMYTVGLAMPLGKKYSENLTPEVPIVKEEIPEVKEKIIPKPMVNTPRDSDNDGVIDKLDKCPNTSEGIKVNKDGCVDTVDLKINFDTNSAVINANYLPKIEAFANVMKENTSLNATIEAHTDSQGSDANNQNLSDRRAISVVNALKALNIDSTRLRAIGYGETQPIASNDTKDGKAQNRRVTGLLNQ